MTSWQWDVALGLATFGLIVALVALRSRTYTDPRCRACDHDLRDATDQLTACPECGRALTSRRAVCFRHRGIARDRVGFGAVIVMLGGAAIVGILTSKPPPAPPGLTAPFATIPTDQLAAQVAMQGMNRTFWAAVAQRVPTGSWSDAVSTAILDALVVELRAQRATLIAAGLSEDDLDERGNSLALRPFLDALVANDRAMSADASRALYHAMYGDDVRLRAERLSPSVRHLRLSAGFGRGPFRLDALPTTTLIWIDDLRLDGASVLDSPLYRRHDRSGFDRCEMMLSNLPTTAEIECDVVYAVMQRPAEDVVTRRQPGPPTNWPVAEDAIRRTTLRHTVTAPTPPTLTLVDDPARDAEIRARIAIQPLHLYEQNGERRLFTSIEFKPDPSVGLYFEVTAQLDGRLLRLGNHGNFRPMNPQPADSATRRIDVPLPESVPADVTHATVTLTPFRILKRMIRDDVSIWGRTLTFDVPIERDASPDANDAPESPDAEGAPP